MCDLTEVEYLPGQVVWVKLGNCWWPGEVKDNESLPEDMVRDFKKKPLAIVKFFGEDSYEYVKNLDNIYHYNNRRKMEFIKKGMDLYRSKSKQGLTLMDKFPTDVVTAESICGGNVNILNSPAFVPEEKVDYKELFESPKKKPKKSLEKATASTSKATSSPKPSSMAKANNIIQIKQRITHPRFVNESDHEIRIRQQPVSQGDADAISHAYKCTECSFGTNRQNLFILHCKSHRDQEKAGGSSKPSKPFKVPTPKPTTTTARGRKTTTPSAPKAAASSTPKASTPKTTTPKSSTPKPKRDTSAVEAARKIFQSPPKKGRKGTGRKAKFPPKTEEELAKEQEKRNKILADWDEDEQEEELEIKKMKLDKAAESSSANDESNEMDASDNDEEEEKKEDEDEPMPAEKEVEKEKEKEEPSKDASSVYDIIEEPEAIVPPPSREAKDDTNKAKEKEELLKEKEKLNKEIDDLLEETALPSLPDIPSLPNIPLNKSDKEQPEPKEQKEEAAAEPKSDSAKTNGEASATTEEAVTMTPAGDGAVDPNTETATYVLVTVDEGGFQAISGLEGMGTTLYIDPSQLSGSGTSLDNLYLAIDEGSMAQLDHTQVALQVGAELAKTSQQDILAAALANTLQTTAVDSTGVTPSGGSEAVVKVTNTTQAPVMTSRVAESSTSSAVNNGSAGEAAS